MEIILVIVVIALLLPISGFLALIGLVLWRKRRIRNPEPDSLIVQPTTDAWVEHQPDGDWLIRWTMNSPTVQIYTGTQPDDIQQFVTQVTNAHEARFTGLDPGRRHYFALQFADGKRLTVAERLLPLEGAANFRDLGGYRAADGRRVRWGLIYRSGSLDNLTERDRDYLATLNLKLVCDLRATKEAARHAAQRYGGAAYVHQPIYEDAEAGGQLRLLYMLWNLDRLDKLILRSYASSMIDQKAAHFGAVLRRLAESDALPAVVHCTAGKDRTGILSALLLLLLGVPEETITADYSLTNLYYPAIRETVRRDIEQLSIIGLTLDDFKALLIANPANLRASLDHIRERYSSAEAYLRQAAGLDDTVIARLKARLLE
jgi:protein-tyrosine phosphatase